MKKKLKLTKAVKGLQEVSVPQGGSGAVGALTQATSMAAAGSQLGPWGAAAGAAVGLGMGLLENAQANRAKKAAEKHNVRVKANQKYAGEDETITQQFKHGGKSKNTKIIEIEGKKTPEIHTDKNFNIKNLGTTPHSKGGDKVLAKEGDVVFPTQNSIKKYNEVMGAIKMGNKSKLKEIQSKLPADSGTKNQDGNWGVTTGSGDPLQDDLNILRAVRERRKRLDQMKEALRKGDKELARSHKILADQATHGLNVKTIKEAAARVKADPEKYRTANKNALNPRVEDTPEELAQIEKNATAIKAEKTAKAQALLSRQQNLLGQIKPGQTNNQLPKMPVGGTPKPTNGLISSATAATPKAPTKEEADKVVAQINSKPAEEILPVNNSRIERPRTVMPTSIEDSAGQVAIDREAARIAKEAEAIRKKNNTTVVNTPAPATPVTPEAPAKEPAKATPAQVQAMRTDWTTPLTKPQPAANNNNQQKQSTKINYAAPSAELEANIKAAEYFKKEQAKPAEDMEALRKLAQTKLDPLTAETGLFNRVEAAKKRVAEHDAFLKVPKLTLENNGMPSDRAPVELRKPIAAYNHRPSSTPNAPTTPAPATGTKTPGTGGGRRKTPVAPAPKPKPLTNKVNIPDANPETPNVYKPESIGLKPQEAAIKLDGYKGPGGTIAAGSTTNTGTSATTGTGSKFQDIGKYAGIANNLLESFKKPDKVQENYVDPTLMKYRDRSQASRNEVDKAAMVGRANARNLSGGNASSVRANSTQAAMTALGQKTQINAQEAQRADQISQFNVGQKAQANLINNQKRDQYAEMQSANKAARENYRGQAMADLASVSQMNEQKRYMKELDAKKLDMDQKTMGIGMQMFKDFTFNNQLELQHRRTAAQRKGAQVGLLDPEEKAKGVKSIKVKRKLKK